MALQILYPNGEVMACQMYIWDVNTLSPVVWDGSVNIGPITIGSVDQGSAGVDPWLVSVTNFPATQPVSIAAPVAVTGPLTDTQLRATPVPISGTVTVDTSLLATAAKQDTGNASLASIDTKLTSPLTVQATNLDIRDLAFATDKVDVSGSSITAEVINAGTFAVQDSAAEASLSSIDGKVATAANQTIEIASLAAIETNTIPLTTAQGADSTDITGPIVQGVINDAPNSYITGNVQALSLTPEGRLRVSNVDSYNDKIWQNTFENPWGEMISTVANSSIPFAGEINYV